MNKDDHVGNPIRCLLKLDPLLLWDRELLPRNPRSRERHLCYHPQQGDRAAAPRRAPRRRHNRPHPVERGNNDHHRQSHQHRDALVHTESWDHHRLKRREDRHRPARRLQDDGVWTDPDTGRLPHRYIWTALPIPGKAPLLLWSGALQLKPHIHSACAVPE